jgi:hypothetical protein
MELRPEAWLVVLPPGGKSAAPTKAPGALVM